MRRKISQSIQAKTFLSMLALLVVCCILIYGMVMIFLPKNYHTELEGQVTSDFYDLMAVLERNGWEASSDSLMEFSMTNNASVEINDNYGNNLFSVNFADMENMVTSAPSMSCSATFQQSGQTYHVFANAALVAVAQSYDILLKLIPLIAVVILLISVIGAVVCSRYYSKPLVSISNVAKRMATLDMTWKCEVNRQDEIGVLAASLNEMAEQLNHALASLRSANWQLKKDIEREREQEKQRVEFFTAVSHELKTPITSILGFTELMTSGVVTDPIQKAQYLERIGEEGRRMSNLIDDILRLSSLESKQAEEVWERVDLRGLCEDIFRALEPIMKKRGITGEIFGAAHYYAYPDDMRQLLKNLMENAVKYNRENGRVTVRISPDAYQCVISVVDTGIGIPLEHQSRVFERFYRVDKGRSKREGGTGLGLSIVKHITAKYAGQITLVSRPDEGTSIRVTLPVTEEGRR